MISGVVGSFCCFYLLPPFTTRPFYYTFYHPPLHRFFDSRDVWFDRSVSYYTRYPCQGLSVPPPPLFLAPTPPPTLAPPIHLPPLVLPHQVAIDSGGVGVGGMGVGGAEGTGIRGASSGVPGAEDTDTGGASFGGAGAGGTYTGGVAAVGAGVGDAGSGGAGPGGTGLVGTSTGRAGFEGAGAKAANSNALTPPPHHYPTRLHCGSSSSSSSSSNFLLLLQTSHRLLLLTVIRSPPPPRTRLRLFSLFLCLCRLLLLSRTTRQFVVPLVHVPHLLLTTSALSYFVRLPIVLRHSLFSRHLLSRLLQPPTLPLSLTTTVPLVLMSLVLWPL
ncbi:unnamed protein product [Closterium sp. NIES-53]